MYLICMKHINQLPFMKKRYAVLFKTDSFKLHSTTKFILADNLWRKINVLSRWIFNTFLLHSCRTPGFSVITIITNKTNILS